MSKKKVLIVGAGIHGLSCAKLIAKEKNIEITILEKASNILMGASGGTHNRAHIGYHYPRSIETARECINGLRNFEKYHKDCLYQTKEFYYVIDKNDSKTSTKDFKRFCDELGFDYEIKWPKKKYLDRTNIDSSFCVVEPCFNLPKIKDHYLKLIRDCNIKLVSDFNLSKSKLVSKNSYLLTDSSGKEILIAPNIIINATYASTNNIQKIFFCKEIKRLYRLQTTEVVVVNYDEYIPPLTVMDGPFITILPHVGFENEYLVYDVINSVIKEKRGFYYKGPKRFISNWEKMLKHGLKYYPFMDKLKFNRSIFASRPVLAKDTTDGRKTFIESHYSRPGLYSILEGKFISAPLMAEKVVAKIKEDGLL